MLIYTARNTWLGGFYIEGGMMPRRAKPTAITRYFEVNEDLPLASDLSILQRAVMACYEAHRFSYGHDMDSGVYRMRAEVTIITDSGGTVKLLENPDNTMAGMIAQDILRILEEAKWTIAVDKRVAGIKTRVRLPGRKYGKSKRK